MTSKQSDKIQENTTQESQEVTAFPESQDYNKQTKHHIQHKLEDQGSWCGLLTLSHTISLIKVKLALLYSKACLKPPLKNRHNKCL